MNSELIEDLVAITANLELENLILGGGYGLLLKQSHLAKSGALTMIQPLPKARATQDLDLFMPIEFFSKSDGAAQAKLLRQVLDGLGYQVHANNYQFGKDSSLGYRLKIDLLAREPEADAGVKFDHQRVGKGANAGVHGWTTPEAFAVEESPVKVEISADHCVFVPHPYAWLNMKAQAAYEWLYDRNEPKRLKHVFDVYVLVAMLTKDELGKCEKFAVQFKDHPQAIQIRQRAKELYIDNSELAFFAMKQFSELSQMESEVDYATFHDGLESALGLSR